MKRSIVYACVGFIAVGLIWVLVLTLGKVNKEDDKGKNIVIYNTGEDILEPSSESSAKPDNSVVMLTDNAEEKALLSSCDTFVCSVFSGSKSEMPVYSDVKDTITSKVSAVSPSCGFIARQANINYSGITEADEEGNIGYVAIADVYCLDMESNSYGYDVVVKMILDSDGAVSNFELYMFK